MRCAGLLLHWSGWNPDLLLFLDDFVYNVTGSGGAAEQVYAVGERREVEAAVLGCKKLTAYDVEELGMLQGLVAADIQEATSGVGVDADGGFMSIAYVCGVESCDADAVDADAVGGAGASPVEVEAHSVALLWSFSVIHVEKQV